MDRAYVSNFFHIWFSTNPEHEIVFVFIWFAKLAEQFQVHNSGIYIALIILWDFWMVWTASSHFRVVLTSNDLILSSPCQENHKREMWTISDKKLNAFLAFLTLSWAELSRGFRLWSFQNGHFTKMLAVPSCWQRHKHAIFVFVLSIILPLRAKKLTLPL